MSASAGIAILTVQGRDVNDGAPNRQPTESRLAAAPDALGLVHHTTVLKELATMPVIGDRAPEFSAIDGDGQPIALRDFAGQNLVLYFYPKDDTPGCTTEACEFRDHLPDFGAVQAAIVGVSKDSVRSHRKFADKFELPFRLLSDEDEAVCRAYDVIQEKSMYGKKYLGIERTTYLIDGDGVIRGKWAQVKVKGHVAEVLAAVKALG